MSEQGEPRMTLTNTVNPESSQEINSRNFYQRNWTKGRRSITLHQCLIPIVSRTFDTIKNLCFSHDILFDNLKTMLRNSPNLRFLSFKNPVLNDIKPFNSPDETISLPKLKQLWFHNTRPLCKNEYWLLEFFTNVVKMGQLKSFHFRMEKSPIDNYSCIEQTVNEVGEKYGPAVDYSIVGKFLIENVQTITDLAIGGEGFRLESLGKQDIEQMKQLKLSHLVCSFDTPKIHDILESQKKLKHFVVKGVDGQVLTWELIPKMIYNATRSSKFIRDFSLYYYSDSEFAPSILSCDFKYNGDDFRKCNNLQRLILGIVVSSKMWKTAPEFTRINNLPRTLTEISITCQDFDRDDFDHLGNAIHEFKNLLRFYICTFATSKYTLKADWIKGLKCLENFQEAEFANVECNFEKIRFMKSLLIPEFQASPRIHLLPGEDTIQLVRRIPDDGE